MRCRLVARDFAPRRERRSFLFAEMAPLEEEKALFEYVAGVGKETTARTRGSETQ